MTTAGPAGCRIRDLTDIYEDLYVDNGLQLEARLDVRGDAYVDGAIAGGGSLAVAGALHTSVACGSWSADVTAGTCSSGPVAVAPPCPCDPTELIPIQEIVAHYADPTRNDNALWLTRRRCKRHDDDPSRLRTKPTETAPGADARPARFFVELGWRHHQIYNQDGVQDVRIVMNDFAVQLGAAIRIE